MALSKIIPLKTISLCLFVYFLMLLPSTAMAFTTSGYITALNQSILFYDVQRSGKLPSWQRVDWRGDSALEDGSSSGVDLTGGYYDAGDNVKFGLPMAYTVTLLSWSVVEFGDSLEKLGQLTHALNAIRWGADYLLKAHTGPTELYVQVGDPSNDHSCWERPEDMDTNRNAYKVDANNPGSDVAGETAAALAAASLAFQDTDNRYSTQLLDAAKRVFDFADTYRGKYSDSVSLEVCPYYCSYNGYEDELAWGAAWLYKASKDITYQQYLVDKTDASSETSDCFDWDNKYIGAQVLLSREVISGTTSLQGYKDQAEAYICSILPKTILSSSPIDLTPGGLIFHSSDVNMQYVTTDALLLTLYAKYMSEASLTLTCGSSIQVTPTALLASARKQVDYILGNNPRDMSFMVGYGNNFPLFVHHRAASLPSVMSHPDKIDCNAGYDYFNSGDPNPNVATGAVVGGPDNSDNFQDVRGNHAQTEPATYITAPLVGILGVLAAGVSY